MRPAAFLVFALLLPSVIPAFADTLSAAGRVVDIEGSPVVGIKVYAVGCPGYSIEGGDSIGSIKAAAVTDAKGGFNIERLPRPETFDKYVLVAFRPDTWLGWIECTGDLNADLSRQEPEPEDGYTVMVSRPAQFTGRVVDDDNQGVTGVTVTPSSLYRRSIGSPGRISAKHLAAVVKLNPAETTPGGAYCLTGIPEGVWVSCSFSAKGLASVKWSDPDKSDQVMSPGGGLSGMVIDEHGKGVPGVWLYVIDSKRMFSAAKASSTGIYSLAGLPPGECQVFPQVENRIAPETPKVVITAGRIARAQDIVVRRGVPLTGRLLDAVTGRPMEGVRAVVEDEKGFRMTGSPSDSRGRYEIRVLPGTVKVYCAYGNPGYQGRPQNTPELTISEKGLSGIDIKLRRCEVAKGRVVDESGRPVARAIVKCRELGAVRADAGGEFSFLVGAGSG